jgi:protein-tyrosine phosphatase
VPDDAGALRTALLALLDRSRSGNAAEIGCLGGHGRTGTALACLAVLTGTPPDEAVGWVRQQYCDNAVETDAQRTFVEGFAASG